MSFDINNPYLRTRVLTARPEELRLMLIDGSLHFMREGREGLASRDFEKSYENLTNAKNILVELMNTLRHDAAPELCARLESLYTYMFTTLVSASLEKDPSKIDEVIDLMEFERETWRLLIEKIARERAGVEPAEAEPGAGAARAPLSVQG